MVKYHVVSIDNEYGHIRDVIVRSSHDSREEAEDALEKLETIKSQAHADRLSRDQENRQRYLDWAQDAIVECPNRFGGFNWTMNKSDPRFDGHVRSIPEHAVRKHNGKRLVVYGSIQIRGPEPLNLLPEIDIQLENWLEHHIAS